MQTTYNLYPAIGVVGTIADLRPRATITRTAQAAINFGEAVVKGTTSGTVIPASSSSTEFLGVALFSHAIEQGISQGVGSTGALYRINSEVAVMRGGPVYVTTNRAVAELSRAYVDISNTTAANRPRFTDIAEVTTITFAGAFVTSNTINMTVNGVAIAQVTFATDTDTTLQAVATSISNQLTSQGITAEVTVNTVARTIRIATVSDITIASIVVAAGASQTTGAAATVANLSTGGIFETASTGAGAIAKLVINLP